MKRLFATLAMLSAGIAMAVVLAKPASPGQSCPAHGDAAHGCARSILFVGNSFTLGQFSIVRRYRPDSVTDLNAAGAGGVPALFKRFAEQSGLDYQVSVEAVPAKTLEWHLAQRRGLLDRRWDDVVLQEMSVLDRSRPGDPGKTRAAAQALARIFTARNPAVRIGLVAPWARPDLVHAPGGRWQGATIADMTRDLEQATQTATTADPAISRLHKVGAAWVCAIRQNLAYADPAEAATAAAGGGGDAGRHDGRINLWASDGHHGSTFGYYLEALVIFSDVTGIDPRTLGADEAAARDLGFPPDLAARLQKAAWDASHRSGGC